MKAIHKLALLLLVATVLASCGNTFDFYTPGYFSSSSSSTTSSSGGDGGVPLCVPGAMQSCYDGPAGTEGKGICTAGMQTCAGDGASWGPCVDEVLPKPEDCATPEDEDCDGKTPSCKCSLLWSKRFGGIDNQYAAGVVTDTSGNVIVTGYFTGSVDFGGGALTSAGGNDIFVAKLNANGDHMWSKRFGDTNVQVVVGIATDNADNVIVTGYFTGSVDFGGGALTSVGDWDIFMVKLDANGDHLWSKRFGDANNQMNVGIATDSADNVIVTGHFTGSVDFGGGVLTSAGNWDIFVAKLDANGDHLWSKRFGNASEQGAGSVAVDSIGNVIVTGYFAGSVDLGGGALTSAGGDDIFVAKLDTNGGHLWSERFGDANDQYGGNVAIDGTGNVLITGSIDGSTNFGDAPLQSAGNGDALLAKFNSGGDYLCAKRFGDAQTQKGTGIATDSAGAVVLTGYFYGSVDFGAGPLMSAGGLDIFIARFSP
jgi:hypothetical protein